MSKQCCKTCAHYDLKAALGPSGKRLRRGSVAKCLVTVPEPVLPSSVLAYFSFHWPPRRSSMGPADGADCRMWSERAGEE